MIKLYTPVLRNRQSEMAALSELSFDIKQTIIPLIDIARPNETLGSQKYENYVQNGLNRLAKKIIDFNIIFLDSSELPADYRIDGERHPLLAAANVFDANLEIIPVTGIQRDNDHNKAVKEILKDTNNRKIGIRLDEDDISTFRISHSEIQQLLNHLEMNQYEVFLILDIGPVKEEDIQQIKDNIQKWVDLVAEMKNWKLIVITLSIPEEIYKIVSPRSCEYIPRLDQRINQIIEVKDDVTVWFGDYTTVHPVQIEIDIKQIYKTVCPKVIYSLENYWFIVRGGPFAKHGYTQFYDLANSIVALDEFSGEHFSRGDKYIYDKAQRIGKPGNISTWIQASINHHITLKATMYTA